MVYRREKIPEGILYRVLAKIRTENGSKRKRKKGGSYSLGSRRVKEDGRGRG